ncbi:MAG: PDZ domain-containing protein [Planctomycetes bacterium]|nr:PDZ domain-containing protein [Planctomycetota bacterium]
MNRTFRLAALLFLFSLPASAQESDARMDDLWKLLGVAPGAVAGAPRPWLGVGIEDSADPAGVRLTSVVPDSPAAKAGLAAGDVLVQWAGTALAGEGGPSKALLAAVGAAKAGDEVTLVYVREGNRAEAKVALVARPESGVRSREHPELPAPADGVPWDKTVFGGDTADQNLRVLAEVARTATYADDGGAFGSSPPNPFRLTEVNYLLEHPLHLPHVARGMAEEVRKAEEAGDLAALLAAFAARLDLPIERTPAPATLAKLSLLVVALRDRLAESNASRGKILKDLWQEEHWEILEIGGKILTESLETHEGRLFLDSALRLVNGGLAPIFQEGEKTAALLFANLGALSRGEVENDLVPVAAADPIVGVTGTVLFNDEWEGVGRIVVGGPEANRYAGKFAIVIDVGGDDVYQDVQAPNGCDSIVLDLAGNDFYSNGSRGQGYGLLASSFHVDLAGNDVYRGADEVQGVGVLGVGVLADLAGDDLYAADRVAQGGGVFGIGILLDVAGIDRYSAHQFAQGFGFTRGFGAIVERAGNDVYTAGGKYEDFREPGVATASLSQGFGFGLRPWDTRNWGSSGGIGAIFDYAGHDLYHGDYFCQGSSYWYALGVLYDAAGRDRYVASRYSQGAGIHLSVGVLLDAEGDDHYATPSIGVSQGCGHDLAAGILADLAGNDTYVSGSLAQGAGNDNALGVLVDLSGDDRYQARGQSQGHGTYLEARGFGSLGLLLDGGGADRYDLGGEDGKEVARERWGYCLDLTR